MDLDPRTLTIADRYKLLIGAIVPRPIAFVSTIAADGSSVNLAPFSFFNGVGSNPMTLLFCPVNRPDGGEKDTLRNAKPVEEGGQGEFVVNVACEAYERKVALAGEDLPYGESEFELTGLTPTPSSVVRPPRLAESPVCFECRTRQVIRLNPGAAGGGNIVIGEVVSVFIRDGVADERLRIDPDTLAAIARMGGQTYCRTRERFEMPMARSRSG